MPSSIHTMNFESWILLLSKDSFLLEHQNVWVEGLQQHPEWLNQRNESLQTPLILAAEKGYTDVVRLLIDAGADLHAQDQDGWTALMHASRFGHSGVLHEFIQAHVDLNVQDHNGSTALIEAASFDHQDCVKMLIDAGAQINLQEQFGWSALMYAAYRGWVFTVQTLLNAGGDLNLQDQEGWTALMYAAHSGDVQTLQCLLAAGADQHLRNHDQQTALDLAIAHHQASAVMLLELFSAQKMAALLSQSVHPLSLNSPESSFRMHSSELLESSTSPEPFRPSVKPIRL